MSSPTPFAAVVLAVAVSGPAWAEPIGEYGPVNIQVRVPVGDLDLTQPSGADELLRRIRRAASRACGGQPAISPLLLHDVDAYRNCAAKAVGGTVARLDAPTVRERYAAQAALNPIRLAAARP
jgi:UrcA family protein